VTDQEAAPGVGKVRGQSLMFTIALLTNVSAERYGLANKKRYISACDKEGNTALHLAVQNGSTEVNYHL